MSTKLRLPSHFTGHLLVAMPQMEDPRFERTVIYMCAHNDEGAMGLVINKPFEAMTFPDLLEQLEIERARRIGELERHVSSGGSSELVAIGIRLPTASAKNWPSRLTAMLEGEPTAQRLWATAPLTR